MDPLSISLQTTIATLLVALISFSAARIRFSLSRTPRTVLDILFLAPLVLPPVLLIYSALHFLGQSQSERGVIAEDALTAIPIFYLCAWMGFRRVQSLWVDAARLQGLGSCGIFWRVWFPPARSWLAAGLVLGLLRASAFPVIALFSK